MMSGSTVTIAVGYLYLNVAGSLIAIRSLEDGLSWEIVSSSALQVFLGFALFGALIMLASLWEDYDARKRKPVRDEQWEELAERKGYKRFAWAFATDIRDGLNEYGANGASSKELYQMMQKYVHRANERYANYPQTDEALFYVERVEDVLASHRYDSDEFKSIMIDAGAQDYETLSEHGYFGYDDVDGRWKSTEYVRDKIDAYRRELKKIPAQ